MKKLFIVSVFLLVFVFVSQLIVRAQLVIPGLIVYYTFDNGTAVDDSGNNNNGTISGAIATVGKIGGALSFDGVNDQVSIATLNHNIGTGDFTWSAWIYPRRIGYKTYEGVMSVGSYSPNLSVNPGGNGQWGAYWGGARNSGDTITPDMWTHVTMAREGGIIRFYKNGIQMPMTHPVATSMANTIFRVGQNGNNSYFYGDIDEVRFYNRALTQSEITEVYNFNGTSVPDTESPTIPTNFSGSAVSNSQINLSWSASTDNIGVAGYRVSRNNGSNIFTTSTTSYADTGLASSTEYSYTVTAFDGAGNSSATSTSIAIATLAPQPPPPNVPPPSAGVGDTYIGVANTPLATYDVRYRDARTVYNVSSLVLDGNGNVSMNGSVTGGLSFYSATVNSDGSQLSQINLLAIPVGGSLPLVRTFVQTEYNDNRYYGWEFAENLNDKYTKFSWFMGTVGIIGRANIDISQYNFDIRQNLFLRTSIEYPDANRAIVRAYAGILEDNLIQIGSIEVVNGVGVIADGQFPADATVPFLTGRRPGMLYHENNTGQTVRPLFKAFADGVSTFNTPRTGALTFFVDYTNGNDANDGLSKTSPWKHTPGMNGFGGNYVKYPGDAFVLKGGTTWLSVSPWTFFSGTLADPIIYTTDNTWFNGSNFTEPVFN